MNADTIIVALIVAAAFAYFVITTVKKYRRLSTPTDHGGCNGACGHDCCNCPFSKTALERRTHAGSHKTKKSGCGCGCCGG